MRTDYISAIWQITDMIKNGGRIDQSLKNALILISKTVNAEAGTIWLYNKYNDGKIKPVFSFGGGDISNLELLPGQGIAGSVIENGRSVFVFDCKSDSHWASWSDKVTGFETRSMICVPLKNEFEIIGCIQLLNKRNNSLFNEDDLELCETLAALAAVAVEKEGFLIRFDDKRRPLISMKGVTKIYPSGEQPVKVLKGIDLDIYEGEFLVILGESGCGKTTLLNLIGGMDTLSDGTYLFDNIPMQNADEKTLTNFRRNSIGFVFQAYNLMPNLTALENLTLISEICENPMNPAEALDKVGLSDKAKNFPSQLSGGQQQRVSIARAIVKTPKLILADEPTAALDEKTSVEVLDVMENIVRKNSCALVMVTHNTEISKMADRIIHIKNGIITDTTINMYPVHARDLQW